MIAEAGQFVTLELRVDNWNPVGDVGSCPDQTPCSVTGQNCVSGTCRQSDGVLDVYQARFNLSELAGTVRLPTVSCTNSLDCRVLGAPPVPSSCDLETGECDVRSAIWIDHEREDYIFFDVIGPFPLVDGVRQKPALANACLVGGLAGVIYKGQEKYAGTIVLEVLPGTEGSLTVDFLRHPDESLLRDNDNFPLTPLRLEPAIITVQGPPIPAVSSWGVVALMLLLLTAGTMALRRRPLPTRRRTL